MTHSFYWADHSTADFASRDLSETVVILPIAAVEQHGPHLPVQVDAAINAAILDRMVPLLDANADVLILPAISIGKSDEHLAYPGTLTISAQTLRLVWLDIAKSVERAGVRKMILFNSHGGQISLMEMTCTSAGMAASAAFCRRPSAAARASVSVSSAPNQSTSAVRTCVRGAFDSRRCRNRSAAAFTVA